MNFTSMIAGAIILITGYLMGIGQTMMYVVNRSTCLGQQCGYLYTLPEGLRGLQQFGKLPYK